MKKDNQFFTTYAETEAWLKHIGLTNYTINKNLIVNVEGYANISNKSLNHIPVQFGIVQGNFFCYDNMLTTLYGSPEKVYGAFYCNNNQLTSLAYVPKEIHSSFYCYNNFIADFNYLEFEVKDNIIFTPIENMDYLDKYKNGEGGICINFNKLKKIQALKLLNDQLNHDLFIKPVKIKHKI